MWLTPLIMLCGGKAYFVALGRGDRQVRFTDHGALLLGERSRGTYSAYRLLAEHGDALFGDEYFADLLTCSPPCCPGRRLRGRWRR